jgi:F-box interacting protein
MSQSSKKPTLWFECIPDDIVFDLLNHMPVKSLIRFMCVSKSFYSTITSPDFINKHLHRAKLLSNNNNHNGYLLCKPKPKPKPLFNHNNHKGVLLCKPKPKPKPVASSSEEELCTVVYNRDRTLTEICRFKIPFDNVRIVGFCNGIFCYTNYHSYSYPYCRQDYNGIIYLWNPSIRKFKKILATPLYKYVRWDTFGFAYHSQNNEFKVLRIVSFTNEKLLNIIHHVAHVYTSSTNSWRKVDFLLESPITRIVRSTLFFNGALHYIAYNGRHKFILSFDLNDEIFREITLPQNPPQNLHGTYTLDRPCCVQGIVGLD